MANSKERISLVGAGNVSHALATLLPQAGYLMDELIVRPSTPKRSPAIVAAKKNGARVTTAAEAAFRAPILWLAVGDSAIRSCADDLARLANWKNKIVLHSSGALTSDELAALRKRGASVASAHPMMSFVAGRAPELRGVAWAIEGDPQAVRAARRIVTALGGKAFTIPKRNKPIYHAFGAFLSPLLVVHLGVAADLAVAGGIPRRDVATFMGPIISRTLANLLPAIGNKDGAGKAFSGPLVRGDLATIRSHLQNLRKSPQARRLYIALLEAALHSDLPIKNRGELKKLLPPRK